MRSFLAALMLCALVTTTTMAVTPYQGGVGPQLAGVIKFRCSYNEWERGECEPRTQIVPKTVVASVDPNANVTAQPDFRPPLWAPLDTDIKQRLYGDLSGDLSDDDKPGDVGSPSDDDDDDDDTPPANDLAYLIKTACPGGTMSRQGAAVALGRLHPVFVPRLAAAIRQAHAQGLSACIYSAYRPPAFGVGGFSDKFNSLHSYGLAVDMSGIGSAGSSEARLWHRIAARHGVVCPYGPNNRAEFNHCQPTRIKIVRRGNDLRDTIAGKGPISLALMWAAAVPMLDRADEVKVAEAKPVPRKSATRQARHEARHKRRHHHRRTRTAQSSPPSWQQGWQ